jgi:hypothetical protein
MWHRTELIALLAKGPTHHILRGPVAYAAVKLSAWYRGTLDL